MTAKPVRLSPAQQHVLDRMREGWTLRSGMGAPPRLWHADSGGCEFTHTAVVRALVRRGLIVMHDRFPGPDTYTLAPDRAAPEGTPCD